MSIPEPHTVDLNAIDKALDLFAKINAMPLADIEWHRDGKRVPVSQDKLDNWKYVAMSNVSFAETYLIEAKDTP